jgi:glycine/D-amino acid oxidase-like deaminating enzyme
MSNHSISIWEKEIYLKAFDVIIVGGGIVGLNTAISLLESEPNMRIAIVDRWYYPLGASTRNAGFATFGSLSELTADIKSRGWEESLALIEKRWKGLQKLLQRVSPEQIDFQKNGGYELFTKEDQWRYEESVDLMDELNGHLKSIVGENGQFRPASREAISGISVDLIDHVIHCPSEGYLHPGKLIKTLSQKVQEMGVEFFGPFTVSEWKQQASSVSIRAKEGISLNTKSLLFATNGFTRKLLPEFEVLPARNQVLLTEPIPGLAWKGCFHAREGYYYFRDFRSRILLGGARNEDIEGETTDQFGSSNPIQYALKQYLKNVIMNGREVKIEESWSGIMGVGKEKRPIIRKVEERIYCAVRLGGMGIAIGSQVGEDAAQLILQDH